MTTKYSVVVISPNSRRRDGSPVIEAHCDHIHSTLSGAFRCLSRLTRKHSDGMYSAKWFRAEIRNADGSPLSEDVAQTVLELEIAAAS